MKKQLDPAELFPTGQFDEIQRLGAQGNPSLRTLAEARLVQLHDYYVSCAEPQPNTRSPSVHRNVSKLLIGAGIVQLGSGINDKDLLMGAVGLFFVRVGISGLRVTETQELDPRVEILQSSLAGFRSQSSGEGQTL